MVSHDDYERLQQENAELRRRLEASQAWMRRQVEEGVRAIARRKVQALGVADRDEFLANHQEVIITQSVERYFGPALLAVAPDKTLAYLVQAEIAFFQLRRASEPDGFTVVSLYQKILDAFFDEHLTDHFRRFARKRHQTFLYENDPLEKALHLVVTKNYSLSLGRLLPLLQAARSGTTLGAYAQTFIAFVHLDREVGSVLLSDAFFAAFSQLLQSAAFGEKRHKGMVSMDETRAARQAVLGDFVDTNAILHTLLAAVADTDLII